MSTIEARRKTERLFLQLRGKNFPLEEGAIKVHYVQRFPPGQCLVAVVIPINHERLGTIIDVCRAHQRYYYPPVLLRNGGKRFLRLIYRFTHIRPNEQGLLLMNARKLAEWAEELFGLPTIVSPLGGFVGARWRLRGLNVKRHS